MPRLLTIRDEQREAFQPYLDEALVEKIHRHLREHAAENCQPLSNGELNARITEAVAHGRSYGLSSVRALTAFCGLELLVGPRFHLHPAARAVLQDPRIPANDRVRALASRLSARDWREAASVEESA